MSFVVSLDSASLFLKFQGETYQLDAPAFQWSSAPQNSASPVTKRTINWKYKATYDDAINLGSLDKARDVLMEFAAMLPPPPSAPEGVIGRWDELKSQLNNLPVLSSGVVTAAGAAAVNVSETIAETSVRITELALFFDLNKAPGTETWTGKGAFTIGLAFTPSDQRPIRLFRLSIQAFGAVLKVEIDGVKVANGQLIIS